MKRFPVYRISEMRQVENNTSKNQRLDQDALIERAGQALYHAIKTNHLISSDQHVLVIYGKGNNGKDAIKIADLLINDGIHVTKIRHDEVQPHTLDGHDVIIDGIFGIGYHGPTALKDQTLFQTINQTQALIISIDFPSGIDGDSGLKDGIAIEADVTLICHAYKRGNLLADAKDHHGRMLLVEMGFEDLVPHHHYALFYDDDDLVWPHRRHHSHKYDYGHLLVIGGSEGMLGAPVLTSHAGFRAGAGLVTWALDKQYQNLSTNLKPEVMRTFYHDDQSLISILKNKDAVVIGPGLGKRPSISIDALKDIITANIPIVIDADGLALLKPLLKQGVDCSEVIITPHLKEAERLMDIPKSEILIDPVDALTSFKAYAGTTLLKGPCTLIHRNQEVVYLPYGTPGLAKAGFGDVLAGLIGAMLLHHDISDPIIMAMMIFDRAAKQCLKMYGEHSMMPSDLIEMIPSIIHRL